MCTLRKFSGGPHTTALSHGISDRFLSARVRASSLAVNQCPNGQRFVKLVSRNAPSAADLGGRAKMIESQRDRNERVQGVPSCVHGTDMAIIDKHFSLIERTDWCSTT